MTTFQVQFEGRVTAFMRFLYEVDAKTGAEAKEIVRDGGGTLIEEEHSETVDSEPLTSMHCIGVWDSDGNDA
jgi:hypothetical protein